MDISDEIYSEFRDEPLGSASIALGFVIPALTYIPMFIQQYRAHKNKPKEET